MRTRKKRAIDWLFPQVRRKVLALLLMHPDRSWYLRDIARRTGSAVGNLRRELTGLADTEILTREREGNRTYYQANRASPLFAELASLLRKTVGLSDVLREALAPLSGRIRVAFIYGSLASGEADAASDVDLMVVGDVTFGEIVSAMGPAQERLGREINPMVLPPAEFRAKVRQARPFLRAVLGSEKIFLVGDERDLAGLASGRSASSSRRQS